MPDDFPVVTVSWHEAAACAAWLGGSLPTEAQWEFAGRGAEKERTYPWGEEAPTCDLANFNNSCNDPHPGPRPVKTGRERGRTPEGVYDLAGNVWEWCRDWYGPYAGEAQTDPLGPPTGSARVLRGGSFYSLPGDRRGANRIRNDPGNRRDDEGFRVVWSSAGGLG